MSLSGAYLAEFEALCAQHGVPASRIGEVTGDGELEFVGAFTVGLDEARDAWQAALPAALG